MSKLARPEGARKHSPGFTRGLPWVSYFVASRPEGAAENRAKEYKGKSRSLAFAAFLAAL